MLQMDPETSARNLLEQMLLDGTAEPIDLPLSLLKAITNNFSDDQIIGRGRFSSVFKGLLQNGMIAVKLLSPSVNIDDSRFNNVVNHLMRVKHKNIVRFLGYCSDTQVEALYFKGKKVKTEKLQRLLCFEYIPGGSLTDHITDVSLRLEWKMQYQIIRGICEGLHHLHDKRIVHLDLKPENIWLDYNMVPKIWHIDESRFFDEGQTGEITEYFVGLSFEYLAPETLNTGVITFKSDIYALGITIAEILTAEKQYSSIVNVPEGWRNRLGTSGEDTLLEQIRVCAEICIRCQNNNPKMRPAIQLIIKALDETESMTPDAQRIIKMLNYNPFVDFDDFTSMDTLLSAVEPSNGVQQSTPTISAVQSSETMELNILERIVAGHEEPSHLDFPLLHSVTESFSENRRIGQGGCGEVYKGILRNADVAVKRLFNNRTIKDKMFHREVTSLITVRHQNIVRFLGYCSLTEERAMPVEGGKPYMYEIRERLLCFEYISNGSLERHLTDELRGLEWCTRFDIIVGICNGLCYLHKEKNITHMDLKPANILIDDQMVPKITDFGLSRLDNNPQAPSTSRLISPGYSAPEYRSEGKSSSKSDIYSLGVIILELVSGSKNNPNITKAQVLRKWRHRWIKSLKHTPLGYQQVTKCIDLAQRCMEHDPEHRPDISDIVQELNEIDSNDHQFQVIPSLEDMLGIEPLEIQFPFEHYWQVSHTVELSNDTDDHFAFVTKPSLHCLRTEPDKGIVPPRSKCSVTVTMMQAQVIMALLNNRYKEEITVLSTRVDGGLTAVDITKGMFMEEEGKLVDEVNVMVVLSRPQLEEES